jgi:hypothetical protein
MYRARFFALFLSRRRENTCSGDGNMVGGGADKGAIRADFRHSGAELFAAKEHFSKKEQIFPEKVPKFVHGNSLTHYYKV